MQTSTCRLSCVSRSLIIPILFALICMLLPQAQAAPFAIQQNSYSLKSFAPGHLLHSATIKNIPGPTISKPGAIYIDATSARGAVVSFTVTASDAVDGPLTPVVDPPSGSLFPIGVTLVQVSATDSSDLTTTASFPVYVLAPRLIVLNVGFNLSALSFPTAEGNQKLNHAFQLVETASDPSFWNSNILPYNIGGSNAFDKASSALNALEDLLHNSDSPLTPSQSATLSSEISRLVNAYRVVALIAISQAPTDTPQYTAALKDLARGDSVTAAHDPIGHYKDAWQDVVFGPIRQH